MTITFHLNSRFHVSLKIQNKPRLVHVTTAWENKEYMKNLVSSSLQPTTWKTKMKAEWQHKNGSSGTRIWHYGLVSTNSLSDIVMHLCFKINHLWMMTFVCYSPQFWFQLTVLLKECFVLNLQPSNKGLKTLLIFSKHILKLNPLSIKTLLHVLLCLQRQQNNINLQPTKTHTKLSCHHTRCRIATSNSGCSKHDTQFTESDRYWRYAWITGSDYLNHLTAFIFTIKQSMKKEVSWIAWPWRWRYYYRSKHRELSINDTVWYTRGHELSATLLWKLQIWYYEDWWLAKESYHIEKSACSQSWKLLHETSEWSETKPASPWK